MAEVSFTVDTNPEYTWMAWGNTSYATIADVIGELIDNSIQAGATECRVSITVEDGKRYLIVEDNGVWGKINDAATLKKCFGYGKPPNTVKTGLNEHNAGLKQVLATTDPTNSNWAIQIKQQGVVWQLKAPYSNTMKLTKLDPCMYDGVMTSKDSTLIRTIISDTQLRTLYLNQRAKDLNISKLMERLKLYLATMWMMHDRVRSHSFRIYLDGALVEPFVLESIDGVETLGDSRKVDNIKLSESSQEIRVEIWKYRLTNRYKTDHPIFRNNAAFAGACIFKHGRLVKSKVFEDIYKILTEVHMSGHLVLVNITGDANSLPSTHTTKNDFNNRDEKLAKLYEYIKEVAPAKAHRMADDRKQSEKQLVTQLETQKLKNNERLIKKGEYKLEREFILPLTVNNERMANKEEVDLLEWNTREKLVTIIEAKLEAITTDNLRQLYFYYRNLKYFCHLFDGYDIELRFITRVDTELDSYKNELAMIQRIEPDFKPLIELFSHYSIYD